MSRLALFGWASFPFPPRQRLTKPSMRAEVESGKVGSVSVMVSGLIALLLASSFSCTSRQNPNREAVQAPSESEAPSESSGPVTDATGAGEHKSGPAEVACTVNGQPIPLSDVVQFAKARSLDNSDAMVFLIQAEVLVQEGKRNAFPFPPGTRVEQATALLASMFSEETLCGHIRESEVKGLYEAVYKPEWPADVYAGELVEIRCCPNSDDPCDLPEQLACKAGLQGETSMMEQLAVAWAKHPDDDIRQRIPKGSLATFSDFHFLDWPGIPEEKQTRKRMLDSIARAAIKALRPGEVSPPVLSSMGLHVFRLIKVRAAISKESPEFQAEGRRYLCSKRIITTRQEYLKQLLQYVDVVEGAVKLPQPR